MSDIDTDDGQDLSESAPDGFLDFMEANVAEDDGSDDGDDEGTEVEADEGDPESGVARITPAAGTEDEDPDRVRGRERLATKLSTRERELTAANRRIKDLEAKFSEQAGQDPDLIDDRVAYVRGQIARGLGLKADHPRVAEELAELMDDLLFSGTSEDAIAADPKLKEHVESRRARHQSRKEQLALDRRIAEIERREAQTAVAQEIATVKGQLDGFLKVRVENIPFLSENPDGHPVEMVFNALMMRRDQGVDLSTAEAMTANATDIVERLEAHYASIADRYAALKARRDAATGIVKGNKGAQRQTGAAKEPKRRTGGQTVTSAKGNGGRGSAPTQTAEDDESFEEFLQKGLAEASAAKRRR